MSSCNNSIPQPLVFVLAGIPGLESSHGWFSVPFFLIFFITLIGNATILCIIRIEKSLHEPMFLLLAMLSIIDLSLVSVTVPRMLSIFWMHVKVLFSKRKFLCYGKSGTAIRITFKKNLLHQNICLLQEWFMLRFLLFLIFLLLNHYILLLNDFLSPPFLCL